MKPQDQSWPLFTRIIRDGVFKPPIFADLSHVLDIELLLIFLFVSKNKSVFVYKNCWRRHNLLIKGETRYESCD